LILDKILSAFEIKISLDAVARGTFKADVIFSIFKYSSSFKQN
jgi:hypothetical protein